MTKAGMFYLQILTCAVVTFVDVIVQSFTFHTYFSQVTRFAIQEYSSFISFYILLL